MARQSTSHRAGVIAARNPCLYLDTAVRLVLFGKQGALDVVNRMRYGYRAV